MSNNKCLPCKTYIMCGNCPYYGRCKYIHDPRIKSVSVQREKPHMKNNIDDDEDIWFWPYTNDYPYYNIYNSNTAIYSLWYNLIDVCNNDNEKQKINKYTNRPRLPIFTKLSV